MKRILVFAVAILTASLVGQVEHAPTVAQCQADQRLWLSMIEDHSQLPKYGGFWNWAKEMGDCEKVDPENKWRYFNVEAEVTADQQLRLSHFLDRHNLWEQFEQEDAAGKR